jgi:hypothetical protein
MADRPFCRIYHADLALDYAKVWRDNDALATYVRLLSVADAMWPRPPEIPASAKPVHVQKLVAAGLVVPVPPDCYQIRGLDAERNARSNAARNAAAFRWRMPNPASPDQTSRSALALKTPKKNGVVLDERELSEEEQRERYIVGMNKRLGET